MKYAFYLFYLRILQLQSTYKPVKLLSFRFRPDLNRGYPCFQVEPTTIKDVCNWFAPVLDIYLNQDTLNWRDKLSRPFTENVEKTLRFPSWWQKIIDNGNDICWYYKIFSLMAVTFTLNEPLYLPVLIHYRVPKLNNNNVIWQ